MDFPLKGSRRNAALLTEMEAVHVRLMTSSNILLRMHISKKNPKTKLTSDTYTNAA